MIELKENYFDIHASLIQTRYRYKYLLLVKRGRKATMKCAIMMNSGMRKKEKKQIAKKEGCEK